MNSYRNSNVSRRLIGQCFFKRTWKRVGEWCGYTFDWISSPSRYVVWKKILLFCRTEDVITRRQRVVFKNRTWSTVDQINWCFFVGETGELWDEEPRAQSSMQWACTGLQEPSSYNRIRLIDSKAHSFTLDCSFSSRVDILCSLAV